MALSMVESPEESYLAGHSCKHCQQISFPGTLDESSDDSKSSFTPIPRYHLGISLKDIREWSDCTFATHLLQLSDEKLRGFDKPDSIQLYAQMSPGRVEQNYVFLTWFEHIPGDEAAEFGRARKRCIQCIRYLVATKEDIAGAVTCTNRRMAVDPLNHQTVISIKKWLDDCKGSDSPTEGHAICSSPLPAWIPSRLIEVKESDGRLYINLVQTRKEYPNGGPEYTALSYRWGASEILEKVALRSTNQESYQENILWEKLPKTLQDAVLTTHKLGIRFLWVDSLCIVQDDKDDKHKEIGQMAQVYSHATLTIIARRAITASDPLLNDRSAPLGSARFTFKGTDGQGMEFTLYPSSAIREKDTMELETRGWCLQENLLSCRVLEIGPWVTEWSCRQKRGPNYFRLPFNVDGWCRTPPSRTHPESQRWGPAPQSDLPQNWRIPEYPYLNDYIMFRSANLPHRQPEGVSRAISQFWWHVVSAYTNRSLSDQKDRSLAISGIAERFTASTSGGRYLAGLWEQDLPGSLLWHAYDDQQYLVNQCRSRPIGYQGPSWSWTAINRHVFCNLLEKYDMDSMSTVLSVECVPLYHEAPFGALQCGSGILKINGPAFDFECRGSGREDHERKRKTGASGSEPKANFDFIWWDLDEHFSDWTSVTLLALYSETREKAKRKNTGTRATEGIALLVEADGRYRRFGTFRKLDYLECEGTGDCSCIEQWVKRDITIV